MDQINNNNEPVVEQEEVMAPEESVISPEMLAEMEAQKDMDLHGNHVQKIGGCAVVTIDGEVVALEMPFSYPQLLSTLIKRKYDTDQSEAITANLHTVGRRYLVCSGSQWARTEVKPAC